MSGERWNGELYIGFAFALFRGQAGYNALHHHYAAQCAYAEDGQIEIERADGTVARTQWAHIPSEEVHRLRVSNTFVRLLYYEPAMACGKTVDAMVQALAAPNWRTLDWSAHFGLPDTIDNRVRQALDFLDDDMNQSLSAAALARVVGLSRNRFMALFTAEIGVPVRRYILWRRLKLAATALASGDNLTTAAHAAGFADSAHFARTMRSMFGVTATDSLRRLDIKLL